MSHALRLGPDGRIDCLYTEAIDLRALGRLKVVRATEITFEPEDQSWEVRAVPTGGLLFSDPSREACLRWERDNLQPSPGGEHGAGSIESDQLPALNDPTA